MFRSSLTQTLQNYFDSRDVRVRHGKSTLEVQLLNTIAGPFEELTRTTARETARSFAKVPLNLDHSGNYYRLQIPAKFPLQSDADGNTLPPAVVQGMKDGSFVNLTRYNDLLPVPSGIEIDPGRTKIALNNSLLFSVTGDNTTRIVTVNLPLPARIHFHLHDLVNLPDVVEILIEGEVHPRTFWGGGVTHHEVLIFSDAGFMRSNTVWDTISRITVHGLPDGAILDGALFQSFFDHDLDDRPFVHPSFRDQSFHRYWSVNGSLLEESFVLNRFAGYDTVQSYQASGPLTCLAVEPNTYGILTVADTVLTYSDRRECMPDRLAHTGIYTEPLYGLSVSRDKGRQIDIIARGGSAASHFVKLETRPYNRSDALSQYRILVESPDGFMQVLTPEGSLATFSSSAGWRHGIPGSVSLLLSQTGTYLFTLEMLDQNGDRTVDINAYANLSLVPAAVFDLQEVVSGVVAIAFDSNQKLWIWTGDFLIPVRFLYDSFLFDSYSNSLYLTDTYSQVNIE